jgi:hypothetical protein
MQLSKFPVWPALVPVILLGFVASVVARIVAMAALAYSAADFEGLPKDLSSVFAIGAVLEMASFIGAAPTTAVFVPTIRPTNTR